MLIFTFVFFAVFTVHSSYSFEYETEITDSKGTQSCPVVALTGTDWILHIRQPNYGWKEDTHRAIIALTVSGWETFTKESERRLMEQQLEVEITKALLRNNSSPIYPNNLALYIHALIATNRNPRDFHGIDLVARLMDLIGESSYHVHPFLLLVLCNAKSLSPRYLSVLEYNLRNPENSKQNLEYKALSLQAYQCAGSSNLQINESFVRETNLYLTKQQYEDGSFGNLYTTALIVQALAPSTDLQWNKDEAIAYLRKHSKIEVNMVSCYMILLALHAEKVHFIKDLHPDLPMEQAQIKRHKKHFVQYSLKVGPDPDVRHTITINVPPNSNFFEIMKLSAAVDPKYNFSYYMDKNDQPSIYSISNIPNDAEENLYWRLCLQTDIEHRNHTYHVKTFYDTPKNLYPQMNQHVIYWYNDKDCEERIHLRNAFFPRNLYLLV